MTGTLGQGIAANSFRRSSTQTQFISVDRDTVIRESKWTLGKYFWANSETIQWLHAALLRVHCGVRRENKSASRHGFGKVGSRACSFSGGNPVVHRCAYRLML
jgi:hypothetical protein